MKKTINEEYYDQTISYLERNFQKINFQDDNLRDNYLKEALKKYIRTVKSIRLLDLNSFHQECDVLIRSLDELVIDIAYFELDAENNYERHDLYNYFELYTLINERCNDDNIDISSIDITGEIKQKHDEYLKKYNGKLSRWSGKSFYDEAQELDEKVENHIMPFTMLFKKIYRMNCLFSHNSGIILKNVYKFLDITIEKNHMYFHNINNVIILTSLLIYVCLPDLFQEEPSFVKEFDDFIGGLNILKSLCEN